MTINQLALTPACWRRLGPELRTELRQALGGKRAIIGRQVLDMGLRTSLPSTPVDARAA